MTTDTSPKTTVVARDGFTVGGMAKGAGMIHPVLATMLAIVTTDYPLEPGEAIELPPPGRRRELQLHLGRRRVLDERHRAAARERRERHRAHARIRRQRSPPPSGRSAPISPVRSSATEKASRSSLEIEVAGAATDEEATAIARRIATSPLVKTAAFGRDPNWGRVLMAAGSAPTTAGSRTSIPIGLRSRSTARPCSRRAPGRGGYPISRGPPAGSSSTSVSARGTPRTSPPTSPTTTSASTRSTRRETPSLPSPRRPCRSQVGGALPRTLRQDPEARDVGHDVIVVHGAGPQISAEMERRGLEVDVRERPALHHGQQRSRSCASRWPRSTRRSARPSGRARSASWATRSASKQRRISKLGLVGDPLPSRPALVASALRQGRIPVVAPLAKGPLNVNADEAAVALAAGLQAERILFVTDVPGVLVDGDVVSSIGADEADRLLDDGTFQGGIVPKLEAAVRAARLGDAGRDRRNGGHPVSAVAGARVLPTYARANVTFERGEGCLARRRRREALPRLPRRDRGRRPRSLPSRGHRGRSRPARPPVARLEPLLDESRC